MKLAFAYVRVGGGGFLLAGWSQKTRTGSEIEEGRERH
jgi:hypothetical protein